MSTVKALANSNFEEVLQVAALWASVWESDAETDADKAAIEERKAE